jgi:hypothetical protein
MDADDEGDSIEISVEPYPVGFPGPQQTARRKEATG